MIEVFKTNVEYAPEADMIVKSIEARLEHHKAGFDLEDCDRILRVQCKQGYVHMGRVVSILRDFGYEAIALEDNILPFIPIARVG